MLHADEIPIDLALVRSLVDALLPAQRREPLRRLTSSGSSNALFRLGDGLLVRLPRQPGGGTSIAKEARWLPHVGPQMPVAVPEVVAVGEPALGYPEQWSVVRWIDGDPPEPLRPNGSGVAQDRLARDLAAVVAALRSTPVPADAVADPALRWYRGEPLTSVDADVRQDVADCRRIKGLDLDLDAAQRLWDEATSLSPAEPGAPQWYHGDLLAENLLVRDGRLVAVLDFGGLSIGDPTVDLTVAWELLDAPATAAFRQALDVDDATWLRARAWALFLCLITFPYYWDTMPERCASRLVTARAVLAGG